jgi:ankyrin repeat protein
MDMISGAFNSASNFVNKSLGLSLWNKDAYKDMSVETLISLMDKHKIGFNDNLVKNGKETVLSNAIEANNLPLVEYICSKMSKEELNDYESHRPPTNSTLYGSGFERHERPQTSIHQTLNLRDTVDRIKILEVLLKKGANPNLPYRMNGNDLNNPLDWADSHHSDHTFAVLVEYGAKHYDVDFHVDDIRRLWKVYRMAFTLITNDETLPQELKNQIKHEFISRISPKAITQ